VKAERGKRKGESEKVKAERGKLKGKAESEKVKAKKSNHLK
jgi:hypothetical protein